MGLDLELLKLGIEIAGGVFLVASYFMLIGFCLVEEKVLSLFRKIFLIGIGKIHWVLLGLLCYLLFVCLSLGLIYFLRDGVLMILGGLVLMVVLVLGKLFLAGVVKEINL